MDQLIILVPSIGHRKTFMSTRTTLRSKPVSDQLLVTPSNYETIYALDGSLQEYPLELSLNRERQAEQKRENQR